ncbi:MAG TPA: triose-phosphate isomerase [Clostridia bacterium]
MRRPIIAGNWKMNNTIAQTKELLAQLIPKVKDTKCEVVVCVPFTDLHIAGEMIKGTNIALGAQNVHWADQGAFTGEISAQMLVELGVKYVIIGHSERRQYFGETDQTVNKRVIQALKNGLIPIMCVGETEQERLSGLTDEVNKRQLTIGLQDISPEDAKKIVIAYEPVWAIGTGRTATEQDADETIGKIRDILSVMFSHDIAQQIRIQYGGSMNAKNADGLMAMPQIDGGLIGGASLKAEDFSLIIKAADAQKKL